MPESDSLKNNELSVDTVAPVSTLPRKRITFTLAVAVLGFLFFLIGARPGLFGLDRSPVVGFIQIATMLVGLAVICIAGYLTTRALWCRQKQSISADFGMRLVSTGYVVTVFSGLADVFGIGSHPLAGVPFFGVWQARGMEIGCAIIAIGFIMMFPRRNSSGTKINRPATTR